MVVESTFHDLHTTHAPLPGLTCPDSNWTSEAATTGEANVRKIKKYLSKYPSICLLNYFIYKAFYQVPSSLPISGINEFHFTFLVEKLLITSLKSNSLSSVVNVLTEPIITVVFHNISQHTFQNLQCLKYSFKCKTATHVDNHGSHNYL